MFENNFVIHIAKVYFRDHASSFPQEIHLFFLKKEENEYPSHFYVASSEYRWHYLKCYLFS